MKRQITCAVECALCDITNADTHELGEAIDMIKDLEEAIYYCTVTEAMEDNYPTYENRKKYYNEKMKKAYLNEEDWNQRDYREGKSPAMRKTYMESKELKQSKEHQMKELERYMKELADDILEMIADASQEEKVMLSQKLTTLAGSIH